MQNDKDTYRKFPGHEKVKNIIFASEEYSWQDRKAWVDRIIAWEGTRSETFEYLAVLYDSVEIAEEMMKAKSDRVKGPDNPAYQHGGKFSPFSDKFVGSATKEEVIAKAVKTKTENPHVNNTRIEHYLNKGLGLCEAIAELQEKQAVGRLDKFIERYGEDEGTRRWNERQERWISSYNDKTPEEMALIQSKKVGTGYTISKAEKDIMRNMVSAFGDSVTKGPSLPYEDGKRYFVYDICRGNRIIEYNGDFWHANPNIYDESFVNPYTKMTYKDIWDKEILKEKVANDNGYIVHRVWEADYKKNKNKGIEECLEFLRAA